MANLRLEDAATLPPGHERSAIVYRAFMDMTYTELMDITGMSEGELKSDVRRLYNEGWPKKGRGKGNAPDTDRLGEVSRNRGQVGAPVSHDDDDSAKYDAIAMQTPPPRRKPARRVLMRGAVFDIECTDFGTEGFAGYLICTCILPLGSDTVTTHRIRWEDHGNDYRLVCEIAAALNEYDILIGHNIQAFDLNWLNSRLMFHGLPVLNTSLIFDTYQVAKSLAIKTRKGLGNLLDYFGLPGVKTAIYRTTWNKVRSPYKPDFDDTMGEVVYHCEQDVKGNRALFDVLYPYALSMKTNPFKVSKLVHFARLADDLEDAA